MTPQTPEARPLTAEEEAELRRDVEAGYYNNRIITISRLLDTLDAARAATPDQIAALEAENERLAARIAEFNADDASLRDAFMAVRNRGGMPPTEEQIIAAYRKGLLMYRGAATPAALSETSA